MNKEIQPPDMSVQRQKLVERKIAETSNEALVLGMDPFLCVIILQTYNGLTVRGAGDSRIVPVDEKQEVFFAKIKALVTEYCSSLPNISMVTGSGPS
jgi:hypothetical protein